MPKTVTHSPDQECVLDIGNNSIVQYYPDFILLEQANNLYQELTQEDFWMQGTYQMFGKPVKTPRLLWAMRDEKSQTNEDYSVTGSSPWSNSIKQIRDQIQDKVNKQITYAQLNYYRTGQDYIGWHTDKEVENGDFIYSISLGTTRDFTLRPIDYKKTDNYTVHKFQLQPGSLLIMDQNAAKNKFKHALPKRTKVTDGRINITFRNK